MRRRFLSSISELKPVQFEIQRILEWDDWRRECIPRLQHASKLAITHLPQLDPHNGRCAIVGAGPSVTKDLNDIAILRKSDTGMVMSVNGAHNWLIENGIIPSIHVLFEHDLETIATSLGGPPHKDVVYYVCSQCSPNIFKELEGYNKVLWHAFCPPQGYQQAIAKYFPGEFMVSGGFATFFRSLTIATILGFRDFDLFGLDSSFEDSSHIDGYAMADKEQKVSVWGRDKTTGEIKKFTTQGGLAFQANEFIQFCTINQPGLRMRVHGDGLLRYLHEGSYPEQYTLNERN